MIGLV